MSSVPRLHHSFFLAHTYTGYATRAEGCLDFHHRPVSVMRCLCLELKPFSFFHFIYILYCRLCPSTVGSSPPPESSIFLCPLLSSSIPLLVDPQCHLSNDVLVFRLILHPLSATHFCFHSFFPFRSFLIALRLFSVFVFVCVCLDFIISASFFIDCFSFFLTFFLSISSLFLACFLFVLSFYFCVALSLCLFVC